MLENLQRVTGSLLLLFNYFYIYLQNVSYFENVNKYKNEN